MIVRQMLVTVWRIAPRTTRTNDEVSLRAATSIVTRLASSAQAAVKQLNDDRNSLEPHFYKLVLIVKRTQSLPSENAVLPVPDWSCPPVGA
jgi:hypothetical protein